jgi:hypothetical protein
MAMWQAGTPETIGCRTCSSAKRGAGLPHGLFQVPALVLGPRSFWYTTPSWSTTKVITPDARYSAGHATVAADHVVVHAAWRVRALRLQDPVVVPPIRQGARPDLVGLELEKLRGQLRDLRSFISGVEEAASLLAEQTHDRAHVCVGCGLVQIAAQKREKSLV